MNSDIFPAFYLSAVTPLGFVSRLSSLCDRSRLEHVYLLKGGSRSLRSQFILDAAAHAENFSKEAALVPSALERDKFEAAFWDNTAVIDAAPPYCIEPLIPSAFEDVLWLGGCYKKELRHKLPEFIELKNCEDELTEQSRKLLFAADELLKDNGRAALCCTDTDKIELQAARTAKKYLKPSKKSIISCVSRPAFGIRKFDLPYDFSLILLQDIHGGCAQLYLKKLFGEAKRLKSEIIVCYSPFAPYSMIDILLIPDAKICFAAESENILFSKPADKIINARRFTDNQKLSRISAHLKQNRKAAQQLYFRSKQYFEEACCCRHKMEEIYSYFFDTTSFDKIRQSFFANIM